MKRIPLIETIQPARKPGFGNYHRRTSRQNRITRVGNVVTVVLLVAMATAALLVIARIVFSNFYTP